MALIVSNLTKSYGIRTLFSGVGFELRRGEKAGLVGANGTGKTTLMRCLLGHEAPDGGLVSLSTGETVGYVEQDSAEKSGSLYQELRGAYRDLLAAQDDMRRLEALIAAKAGDSLEQAMKQYAGAVEFFERGGGYEMEARLRRVAFGLGFGEADLERPVSSFSGGQKTRISLVRALIRQPDFLFLDEPTNHLDITMVEWLEEFLLAYPGGVLLISHDRYFLDKVAGRMFELENQKLSVYQGGYSEYVIQKTERLAALEASYEKQQAYIAKTEAYIERYRAGIKSKQARGRQSQLNRLQRIEAPVMAATLQFAFGEAGDCAERVAEAEALTTAYGERTVFEKLSFLIRRGERVALAGPNGAGKSTLLKVLTGDVSPVKGRIKLGNRVKIGYFDQEHQDLNLSQTVLDELVNSFAFSPERARSLLGAFLFGGDAVFRRVGELSGGEKARLALLKLLLSGANFLLLDEPTNHLDIPSREAVEDALLAFPGTVLTVSHDRYFLDKIADRVLVLADGGLTDIWGNYSDFRERQASQPPKPAAKPEPDRRQPATPRQSETGGRKPSRLSGDDLARRLEKLELEIREWEALLKMLDVQLNDPASFSDPQKSQTLAEEYARRQQELAQKYEQWMDLQG
ncbi:MAG: ABC-F family ATP-binding cassette domain-containing protein [Sporomusaceae bacterium]|nr:ABC-F family ATP-binding cassette domain-containing protein [Sporomusaceae bacterium]